MKKLEYSQELINDNIKLFYILAEKRRLDLKERGKKEYNSHHIFSMYLGKSQNWWHRCTTEKREIKLADAILVAKGLKINLNKLLKDDRNP